MEIKLNKTLSITFSAILLISFTIGIPLFHFLINQGTSDNRIDFSLRPSWFSALFSFLEHLSPIFLGIWMFVNARNYGIEKWTWLTLGLIYSDYALILLLIMLIIENPDSTIDIFKSFQNLLIILLVCHLVTYLTNVFYKQIIYKVLDGMGGYAFFGDDMKVVLVLTTVFMIVMNVFLAIGQFRKQYFTSNKHRAVWMIATMFFGLLPIILHRGILKLKDKNNAA